MREERGQIPGGVVVYEEYTLWGSIGGDVKVIKGGKFYLRGTVYGNLLAEAGGRVHIFGNITGDVTVQEGAKVIHSGVIGGDLVNLGGRLFVGGSAQVMGKIKTRKGETVIEPRHGAVTERLDVRRAPHEE